MRVWHAGIYKIRSEMASEKQRKAGYTIHIVRSSYVAGWVVPWRSKKAGCELRKACRR